MRGHCCISIIGNNQSKRKRCVLYATINTKQFYEGIIGAATYTKLLLIPSSLDLILLIIIIHTIFFQSKTYQSFQHVPQSFTTTGLKGFPCTANTLFMASSTSIPSTTRPKATCLPFKCGHSSPNVIKN